MTEGMQETHFEGLLVKRRSTPGKVSSWHAKASAAYIQSWPISEGEGGGENGEGDEVGGKVVYDQAALIELLGEDIAALLGEEIAGATAGNITTLLNEYIAGLIENKMLNSVADSVEESVKSMLPGMIEEMETPSAGMTIVIYWYQGEGG